MKTLTLQAEIPPSRELRLVLPSDVPTGPRTIVLMIDEPASEPAPVAPRRTLGDLLDSGLVGLWADRQDIVDSAAFARELREKVARREA
jgi:hypothetical protein